MRKRAFRVKSERGPFKVSFIGFRSCNEYLDFLDSLNTERRYCRSPKKPIGGVSYKRIHGKLRKPYQSFHYKFGNNKRTHSALNKLYNRVMDKTDDFTEEFYPSIEPRGLNPNMTHIDDHVVFPRGQTPAFQHWDDSAFIDQDWKTIISPHRSGKTLLTVFQIATKRLSDLYKIGAITKEQWLQQTYDLFKMMDPTLTYDEFVQEMEGAENYVNRLRQEGVLGQIPTESFLSSLKKDESTFIIDSIPAFAKDKNNDSGKTN